MDIHSAVQAVKTFGSLDLLAKSAVQGFVTGLHKSPLHGFSVEFLEHRQYLQGESTRHVDWKLFGKTDKLYTKKYEQETNLRCHFLLDTSASMHYATQQSLSKKDFSAFMIACITELLKKQRDAFGLTTFGAQVETHIKEKSSASHIKLIHQRLEQIMRSSSENANDSQLVSSIHWLAEHTHKRSLVVIFSDLMCQTALTDKSKLFSALEHLKHKKHEVIVFHVANKDKEIGFNFENRPYTFIDLESQEKIKVSPAEIKEKYKESIQAFLSDIKLRCGQQNIDFFSCDTGTSFDQVLRRYLIKRNKVA